MGDLEVNIEEFQRMRRDGYLPMPIDDMHSAAFVKLGGSFGKMGPWGNQIKATLPPGWHATSTNFAEGQLWDGQGRCRGGFRYICTSGESQLWLTSRYQLRHSESDDTWDVIDNMDQTPLLTVTGWDLLSAHAWLDQNFPEWRWDPTSYWDDPQPERRSWFRRG